MKTFVFIYLYFVAARSASQRLRGEVDNLITQCANEMWSHWNNSNMTFQQRISESTDAHNKLQSHLSKTMQEIYDQEKHIESLKQAIRAKGNPLKVAQTRLEARAHRPDVELCRDPPHHRLVEEVNIFKKRYFKRYSIWHKIRLDQAIH